LPTGGFVASSGLESFVQHGFIATTSTSAKHAAAIPPFNLQSFLKALLSSYAQLNLSFFARAHHAVWKLRDLDTASLDATVSRLVAIDAELEAMLLNHVARRASKAQGIALLTLYSRAFALPLDSKDREDEVQLRIDALMEMLKTLARGRTATLHGHLPTCFAVMCAALGLSLGQCMYNVGSHRSDANWR
jgi:urease accessory protein